MANNSNYAIESKFMCTVETKSTPVTAIFPNISRYSTIKKKLNSSEIATCLLYNANVTLHKNNGANVKLDKGTCKSVLLAYKRELEWEQAKINEAEAEKINAEKLEKMKKENTPTTTTETPIEVSETESLEQIQADPEDPDTSDWSALYDGADD